MKFLNASKRYLLVWLLGMGSLAQAGAEFQKRSEGFEVRTEQVFESTHQAIEDVGLAKLRLKYPIQLDEEGNVTSLSISTAHQMIREGYLAKLDFLMGSLQAACSVIDEELSFLKSSPEANAVQLRKVEGYKAGLYPAFKTMLKIVTRTRAGIEKAALSSLR